MTEKIRKLQATPRNFSHFAQRKLPKAAWIFGGVHLSTKEFAVANPPKKDTTTAFTIVPTRSNNSSNDGEDNPFSCRSY